MEGQKVVSKTLLKFTLFFAAALGPVTLVFAQDCESFLGASYQALLKTEGQANIKADLKNGVFKRAENLIYSYVTKKDERTYLRASKEF